MESGTKSRIKNILNSRKPVSWVVILLVVVIIGVGIVLLANPPILHQKLEKSTYDGTQQNSNIQITIKDNDIGPDTKNVTIVLKNNSDIKYIYGIFTILETQIDQIWYTIPIKEGVNWTRLAYSLEPNSQIEKVLDLSYFYGNLNPGKYRFVEEISTYEPGPGSFVISEFTVNAKSGNQNASQSTETTIELNSDDHSGTSNSTVGTDQSSSSLKYFIRNNKRINIVDEFGLSLDSFQKEIMPNLKIEYLDYSEKTSEIGMSSPNNGVPTEIKISMGNKSMVLEGAAYMNTKGEWVAKYIGGSFGELNAIYYRGVHFVTVADTSAFLDSMGIVYTIDDDQSIRIE